MNAQILLRRGLAEIWTGINPTLGDGEIGLENDTGKFKIGDGETEWNSLQYFQGEQGPIGEEGPAGPQGDPGIQGEPGPGITNIVFNLDGTLSITYGDPVSQTFQTTNTESLIGPQGPQGDPGQGLSITGTVADELSLPTENNTLGDFYIALDTGNGFLWNGTTWDNTGTIRGPIGYTGSQGTQGDSGPIGLTGSQGEIGPIGLTGSQGNIGFTGSQGDVGSQGPIGFTGSQGTTLIYSRSITTATAENLNHDTTANLDIVGFKGYTLLKIQTSHAAWVRIYTDSTSRTNDASRSQQQDPLPSAGVITEVITTGAETVLISPAAFGFNNEDPVTTNIPVAVTNLSGVTNNVSVTLTVVQVES
jgi:hypothetical protein